MGLDGGSVTVVLPEIIEVHQMGTRTIDEEAEELLEDSNDRQSLMVFAHRTKQTLQMGGETDPPQIPNEQTQSCTTRDGVVGDLNVVDDGLR